MVLFCFERGKRKEEEPGEHRSEIGQGKRDEEEGEMREEERNKEDGVRVRRKKRSGRREEEQ